MSSSDEGSPRVGFAGFKRAASASPPNGASGDGASADGSSPPPAKAARPSTELANVTGTLLAGTQGDADALAGTYGPGFGLMAKMGYKAGKGLGKEASGRVEPVGLSTQKGRRGLGTAPGQLDTDYATTWDFAAEDARVEETVTWISCPEEPSQLSGLGDWVQLGPRKLSIDDETSFVDDPSVLADLLAAKNVFDELPDRELQNARTRANPYESIKGAFFQNRAATKMANLDALLDFRLTSPRDPSDGAKEWVPTEARQLFYFADVCAGPGGFTEYALWKRGWSAHGFGMTLKGDCDFRLDKFLAAPSQLFETFYGLDDEGGEGDGDVTLPRNLRAFEAFVKGSTEDGEGVHLFMADGGFSVAGQENIQEILSKRIYLCQFLCGLSVLRPGGNFVCKLFDLFTPFSVGLVYLMYRAFGRISLHKPHTSRPANSERYILCEGLRDSLIVREFLRAVNDKMEALKEAGSGEDVRELVPLPTIQADEDFWDYLLDSNSRLAVRQKLYLDKYKAFAKNPSLMEPKQDSLRSDCLRFWGLPDQRRMDADRPSPRSAFETLVGEGASPDWLPRAGQRCGGGKLKGLDDLRLNNNVPGLDLRLAPVCEDSGQLILSLGRFIFAWEGSRWEPLSKAKLFLPKDTLLFGEMTFLYRGKGKGQMKQPLLRVFDAHTLGGVCVAALPFDQRQAKVAKFCAAVSHELSVKDAALVRPADVWKGRELESQRERMAVLSVKGAPRVALYRDPLVPGEEPPRSNSYVVTRGAYVTRMVAEGWRVCWSRSAGRAYYWSPPQPPSTTPLSVFPHHWATHPELVLTFQGTMRWRRLWDFGSGEAARSILGEEAEAGLISVPAFANFAAHNAN